MGEDHARDSPGSRRGVGLRQTLQELIIQIMSDPINCIRSLPTLNSTLPRSLIILPTYLRERHTLVRPLLRPPSRRDREPAVDLSFLQDGLSLNAFRDANDYPSSLRTVPQY